MIEITLNDYAAQVTQRGAAKALCVSPTAIRKALSSDRKIIVRTDDKGVLLGAYEIKDFGREPAVL